MFEEGHRPLPITYSFDKDLIDDSTIGYIGTSRFSNQPSWVELQQREFLFRPVSAPLPAEGIFGIQPQVLHNPIQELIDNLLE